MSGFEILDLLVIGATEGGGFNWRFVIEHAVNLLILLGVLFYFLKNPVKNFLAERRNSISSEIDEAQHQIAEAKKKYEEYAQRLSGIEREVNNLKETIVEQGQKEKEELIKQATQAARMIKEEARDSIARQTSRAKQEIQSEVVARALSLAEELIRKNISDSDRKRFIQNFTNNLEGQSWDRSQH